MLLGLLVACDTTASSEESPTSSVTPVSTVVEDIAQGVTVDGYHFLGQEDAPVVIQFYSDFF